MSPTSETERSAPLGLRNAYVALFLVGLTALFFVAVFQRRLYGDAAMLISTYGRGEATYFPLHHRLVETARALGLGVQEALRFASWAPASLAPGFLYAGLRRLGSSRPNAVAGALLALGTGGVVFFGSTIEVHGVQIGGAAAAFFLLSGLGTSSSRGAALLGGLGGALLVGTHPTSLALLPGVLVWVFGSERAKGRGGWGAAAGALALQLVAAVLVVKLYSSVQQVGLAEIWGWLWWDPDLVKATRHLAGLFWLPMGLLGLLATFGMARDLFLEGGDRVRGFTALSWCVPMLVALALMRIDEHGAYFLALTPALAWSASGLLAAAGEKLAPVQAWLVGSLLVTTQLWLGLQWQRAYDLPLSEEEAAWIDGCLEVTEGKGMFVTVDQKKKRLAEGYTTLQTLNALPITQFPYAEMERFLVIFNDHWRERTLAGEPLYIGPDFVQLCAADETAGQCKALLDSVFDFEPVESGPFHALRGSVRPPH